MFIHLTISASTNTLFSLWNYNPDNSDSHGDFWNGENFSWFSRQHLTSPPSSLKQNDASLDDGARLLSAVVRPYAAKVAGIPLAFTYEMNTSSFFFAYSNPSNKLGKPKVNDPPLVHPPILACETEIFIPVRLSSGRNLKIVFGAKGYEWRHDEERQTLFVVHQNMAPGAVHEINVWFDPPPEPRFPVDASILQDFAKLWTSLAVLLVAVIFYSFRA